MKKCKFCKVKLRMHVSNAFGSGLKDWTRVGYYWCPKCGLMYKGEKIEGFHIGDD